MRIKRHFVTIDGRWGPRQVHYRRCGDGPALLLLHQSPQSSAEYVSLMEHWGESFTVIAPDHPGYGISDPLGDPTANMEEFAVALAEFMSSIGLESAAVYGFHTGAGMAVALAARYPERVSCLVANGFVVFTDRERENFLANYLPPFRPAWDGSHLAWLWVRNRDQQIFFPWYDQTLSARMDRSMPDPEYLNEAVIEFLRAGDNYRVAYAAAFRYRGDLVLRYLRVPTLITATAQDPLRDHLDRIGRTSEQVEVRPGDSFEETLEMALEFLKRHPGADAPEVQTTCAVPGNLWNQMVDVRGGQLRVQCNLEADGLPVLIQHGAGGAAETVKPVATAMQSRRPVIVVELPGHGESDNTHPDEAVTVARYREALTDALDGLGVDQVDVYGQWGGGLVVLDLARTHAGRVQSLAISGLQYLDDNEPQSLLASYAPAIVPAWHGGHLMETWHMVRDQSLYWPWFHRSSESTIRAEPQIDAESVHTRFVAMLKAGSNWRHACLSFFQYPVRTQLAALRAPILLCAAAWDPNRSHTQAAASAVGACQYRDLPDDQADWATALIEFFGQ